MLEERREGLEQWMQCLASVEPIPWELTEFLDIPEEKEQTDVVTTKVFGFRKDPFITENEVDRNKLDMITEVTLNTFYNF